MFAKRNPKRTILIIGISCVLIALWIIRYVTFNAKWRQQNPLPVREIYQLGEMVPLEKDQINGRILDGYYVQVNSFEITEYEDYLAEKNISEDIYYPSSSKLAIVKITIYNEDNETEGFAPTDMRLHGFDTFAGVNRWLLIALNPVLEGYAGIMLPPHSKCELIVPFDIQRHMHINVWDKLEQYEFFLHLTSRPEEKDIKVQ